MPDDFLPLTVDDLYRLGWLEQPRVSPDGRWVAYVYVTPDRAGDTYRRAIWLAPTDGGPPRRFTAGEQSDTAPCWSPDSRRLAFVSTRSGTPQIYLIDRDGGEARRLTSAPHGASAPAWHPGGTQIAFLAPVSAGERAREDAGEQEPQPEDAWERRQAAARREHEEQLQADPRVISRLPYRSGTDYFNDRRSHVYVVDVPPLGADVPDDPPPRTRRLTDGDLHHSPPVWMPDGQSLLTSAPRDPESGPPFAFRDIVRVPVPAEGRGEPQRLTGPGHSSFDPVPAPDGRLIAFRRVPEDRPLVAGARVAVVPTHGGVPRELTANADLSAELLRWLPDGRGLLYSAGWRGAQAVYRLSLDGTTDPSPAVPASGGRIVSDADVGPDGSVAFIAGSPANPCELFLRGPDGAERQLTAINRPLLERRRVAPFEELVYRAPDGREVQGWLLYPPDAPDAGRPARYPLAVYIHGGPHAMWGPGLRSMWHEWQAAAARGYAVFFCNPRGSEGYGERWRDGIHANWGLADAPDIHAGIDAALARGDIDPQRVAVTGGSYGGFMTAWLLGQSDRFTCGVAARGVYGLLSHYGTCDLQELLEFEFDGYPWDMPEKLWRHSPLAYAHQISAPLLILHSELDYRVPISEAEQLFTILRRRKQVVELVRYPREGHELTRSGEPRHRADHMRRTLDWFDRFCQPQQAGDRRPQAEDRG